MAELNFPALQYPAIWPPPELPPYKPNGWSRFPVLGLPFRYLTWLRHVRRHERDVLDPIADEIVSQLERRPVQGPWPRHEEERKIAQINSDAVGLEKGLPHSPALHPDDPFPLFGVLGSRSGNSDSLVESRSSSNIMSTHNTMQSVPDCLYYPYTNSSLLLARSAFGIMGIVAFYCMWVVDFRGGVSFVLLTSFVALAAFEVYVCIYRTHRKAAYLDGEVVVGKVIGKRITPIGPIYKVTASYSVNGRRFVVESSCPPSIWLTLTAGMENPIRVRSRMPAIWVVDKKHTGF